MPTCCCVKQSARTCTIIQDMARVGDARTSRRRTNLKDEVARHVRDLILAGEVRPGERIDQDDIAAQFGVSRLPVREALIILEADGLIVNIPHRGSFVAPLSPDDIFDHFEMYGLISGIAASRVAREPIRTEIVSQLEEIQGAMRATNDGDALDDLNFRFHQVINRMGASNRLRSVLKILSNNMPTHFFSHSPDEGWLERTLSEHDEIIAAIRDGDSALVSAVSEEHFRHTADQAIAILRGSGFWGDPPTDDPDASPSASLPA